MPNWALMNCCQHDQVVFLTTIGVFTVVILLLWRTVLLTPFKLIIVFLHEASHAIACKLTCGHVEGIQVHENEGRVTQTRGGVYWLILPAGLDTPWTLYRKSQKEEDMEERGISSWSFRRKLGNVTRLSMMLLGRTSRHSYTELEADLQAKWGTTEQIDRPILWKEARKDSSGNYVTERDKVMGEAIEDMLE
ncbi:uncharacterized protein LOC133801211 isoform X1 [Humulus lupulus]|uniref:uncharacterized protein LOC133801211 isoform X1 n=1 Tax=Humulus lupulus TaxID=3486 RepID=UPI002B40A3AA|nr:uncharacterized protein LOC133801211 isoform X1 [Humulus lupulus]XP_062095371.1 uncharacterized protein LOC133801211 isoform X1 [Humulus lupulus]